MLENDNTVLIKGLKKVVNVKFSRNTHLIETSYDRLKSKYVSLARENLAKAGVFDGLQISMNIKDITIPLIIHYYLLRAFRTLQIFTLNPSVSSVSAPGRWHNAIRVRAKPCVHRFNYSRTLPQRSSPSGLWT